LHDHGIEGLDEVQAEGMVRDLGSFARFLEAVSLSHACVLNVTAVARECETSRKTVEGYLQILDDLLLSFTVPVFSREAKRGLASTYSSSARASAVRERRRVLPGVGGLRG
jgi:predicted AAA+ superfamily ATPase